MIPRLVDLQVQKVEPVFFVLGESNYLSARIASSKVELKKKKHVCSESIFWPAKYIFGSEIIF
jgi:hypothetical protein